MQQGSVKLIKSDSTDIHFM